MVIESENKDMGLKSEKKVVDYIREIWSNFKSFVSSVFSVKKDSSAELSGLKSDLDAGSSVSRGDVRSKSDVLGDSVESANKKLRDKLKEICVRSRTYGEVNKNDAGFVSFGKLQFHGDKSKKIMHNIKSANPSRFASIMTDSLFKNIDVACTSVRNDNQVLQFKRLMEDPSAQQEMDKVVDETIDGYLDFVRGLGVTDVRAILAFGRICNFGIGHAKKVKENMEKGGANFNDYNQVIDYYEKSVSGAIRTKFQKKYACFGNKNLREVIGEYRI